MAEVEKVENINEVDAILRRHRGELDTSVDFERKPVSEAGEVFANLDNKRLINFNTITNSEGRRCYVILDELDAIGIPVNERSHLSQTHKEISVSLQGKGREQKTDIGRGLIKARTEASGLGNLFQRQPPDEAKPTGDKNG
jgi:hypothetical protein